MKYYEHLNDENLLVLQNRLEEELPVHRIEVSYDMGWQVRSSGGKYGSRTGYGLLIGARTKKVLDSTVFNKKCTLCTRQYSQTGSYENIKKHNCTMNYQGTSKSMEAEALVQMLQRAPEKSNVSI
jgi:ribosomal protein L37AE/L43A